MNQQIRRMNQDNHRQPEGPQLPASICTRVVAAGQLLDFDEDVEEVVAQLEIGRVGGSPVWLRADRRRVAVSSATCQAWITAWDVNPKLQVVSER
jgi:hypothetical protein